MASFEKACAPYSSAELESVEERFREKVPRPPASSCVQRLMGCARVTQASKGNEMVLQLVHSLGEAMVYPDPGNFRTNRKLWCAVVAAETRLSRLA